MLPKEAAPNTCSVCDTTSDLRTVSAAVSCPATETSDLKKTGPANEAGFELLKLTLPLSIINEFGEIPSDIFVADNDKKSGVYVNTFPILM